jgi:hypothetical protein
MLNRNAVVLVAGAAIFTLASAASAQDSTRTRPRSQRHIPVTKEAPGEVTTPHVDTVTVYKTDTLRVPPRVDPVTTTNTVTVHDTVTNTIQVRPPLYSGLYLGFAGGTNLPYGSIRSVNNPAATGQVELGWQKLDRAFGLRADAEFNQFSHAAQYAFLGPKPQVWNVNADVRLDLPIFKNFLGGAARFVPYVLGGGSFVAYKDLRAQIDDNGPGGVGPLNADIIGSDHSFHNDFGWNAGGGLAVHFGRKELFVESRLISFNRGTDDSGRNFGTARQIPIVFGINFY